MALSEHLRNILTPTLWATMMAIPPDYREVRNKFDEQVNRGGHRTLCFKLRTLIMVRQEPKTTSSSIHAKRGQ